MLDSLISWLKDTWKDINPLYTIMPYEKGIHTRLGKIHKISENGWHFKLPFIDEIIIQTVVLTTLPVRTQSLCTKDGHSVVVEAIVKYSVGDLIVFYTEVYDTEDALNDITQGVIFEQIRNTNWDECSSDEFQKSVTRKVRAAAKRFGIEIDGVTFSSMDRLRTIRIISSTSGEIRF